MPMVALIADVHAHVVQQSGVLEPGALAVAEPVQHFGLIEQRQRDLAHLAGVIRFPVGTFGQLDD